jgi:hypothetical protein
VTRCNRFRWKPRCTVAGLRLDRDPSVADPGLDGDPGLAGL